MNDYFNSNKWKKFLSENKKYSVEEGCGDMPPLPPAPAPMAAEPSTDDHEGEMARSQLQQAAEASASLMSLIQDGENLPAWVQAKLTKASDYLDSVRRYMEYKETSPMMEEEDMSVYDDITKAPLHMPPRPDKPSKAQANKITHAEVPVELINDLTEYLEDMAGLKMKGSDFIARRARDLLAQISQSSPKGQG